MDVNTQQAPAAEQARLMKLIVSISATTATMLGIRPYVIYWHPCAGDSPFAWHECGACATLIRPKEYLCSSHLVLVPAGRRMYLAAETWGTPAWVKFAHDAIRFARRRMPLGERRVFVSGAAAQTWWAL